MAACANNRVTTRAARDAASAAISGKNVAYGERSVAAAASYHVLLGAGSTRRSENQQLVSNLINAAWQWRRSISASWQRSISISVALNENIIGGGIGRRWRQHRRDGYMS